VSLFPEVYFKKQKHIVFLERIGFIGTGTKDSITDRLEREVLQECKYCILNIQA